MAAALLENDAMSLSRAFMILMLGIAAPSFLVGHSLPVYAQDGGGDSGGDSGGDDGGSDDGGSDDDGGGDDGGDNASDVSDTADTTDAGDYLVDANGNFILDGNGKRVKKPKTVDLTKLDVGDTNANLNSHATKRQTSR